VSPTTTWPAGRLAAAGPRPDCQPVDRTHPSEAPIHLRRNVPFLALHLACAGVLWVGFSWTALVVAAALYALRMFAITGFYHRYFSHKTFRASRPVQFLMGLAGTLAVQKGPLWWAAHHRHHHAHSDHEDDVHSPRRHGLFRSHVGWFLTEPSEPVRRRWIPDLTRYRELILLDRFHWVPPLLLAAALAGAGALAAGHAPGLGTSAAQLLVWGFAVSTVVLYHATYTINSLSHRFGRRRFATDDDSRNNWLLALLTFGEGWHNNHHHYPAATRQGFYWWEIDLTYYGLWLLSRLGVISHLKPVPARALSRNRVDGRRR
jgi:stearoyl-CoA desaturase (delta-9 desaturase)